MNGIIIAEGRAMLGIELGSTRIKACLIGPDAAVLAVGSHDWENDYTDKLWTYSLDAVWSGVQAAYADLVAEVQQRYGITPAHYAAMGVSAMMHGYLPFDAAGKLLTPFRTWRNTNTRTAAAELTDLLGVNIPMRWSIAHLHQAVLDAEPHLPELRFLTTLAGYVHWKLTGRAVIGIGDASGMFPIDSTTADYDDELVARYDAAAAGRVPGLRDLLPEVLVAGAAAGELTAAGAALLDPTGNLRPGIPFCPPEGDAGTGMVATGAVAPRTGNISVGTSIFAMVVLERPLGQVHQEIDLVTTPAGDAVAMVHCNNGASELAAWATLFGAFAAAAGTPLTPDATYAALLTAALAGEPDAGGLLVYNHLAGEPIAGLDEGRPLLVRAPDSRLTLPNFARAQLYGVFGTLALGMSVLHDEHVQLDRMYAHGGLFRTAGVAQRFLAAALDAPVVVAANASEGGAWGIAVLAAYVVNGGRRDLNTYLREAIFADTPTLTTVPEQADVDGFETYLDRYRVGLTVEAAAVQSLSD